MFRTLRFVLLSGVAAAILLSPLSLLSADDNDPPAISMTAEAFVKALSDEGRAASSKRFAGKQIELTGNLQMFDISYSGGSYIFLAGAKFWAVHDEPWALALPGQTIKVRGIYRGPGGFKVTITEASGKRLVVTATDLAEQFERDAQATGKKYGERWMELRGIVSNKPKDSIDRSVLALRGAGKTDVMCFVQQSFVDSVKVGHAVRIVGRYSENESASPTLFEGKAITDELHSPNGSKFMTLKGHTDCVNSVAFSPDGKRLASASGDKTIKLWDLASGKEVLTCSGHAKSVQSVAFCPDATRFASASWDQTVKVWDTQTGREVLTFQGHSGIVYDLAYSPDGKRIASASADGTVQVWDANTGRRIHVLDGRTGRVFGVTFSPDGKRLASANENHTVKLWDAASGKETGTIQHAASVPCVVFGPDGKRLASAGYDEIARVFDSETRQQISKFQGHTDIVADLAFSRDGTLLASAGLDNTVRLWNTESSKQITSLRGHDAPVCSVAFSPDDQRLASGGFDDTIILWTRNETWAVNR